MLLITKTCDDNLDGQLGGMYNHYGNKSGLCEIIWIRLIEVRRPTLNVGGNYSIQSQTKHKRDHNLNVSIIFFFWV